MACDCTANASAPAVRRAGWPVDPRVSPVPRNIDPRVTRRGLWDGTRAATYVFPSTRPERVVEPTEPPGPLPWTVSRDPAPFGATFTELRNLNPPADAHLYPWIRDLLTPGISTTRFVDRGPAVLDVLLLVAPADGSREADGLGVSDWGAPFEEIDP
jgi:hypothetical protein